MGKECCECKKKQRSEEEYKALINRLNRIEGQVRGIKKMVETDTYCTDILVQVSAVNAALNAFNRELLANHIRSCVADDIKSGKDETIDELVATLQKLNRELGLTIILSEHRLEEVFLAFLWSMYRLERVLSVFRIVSGCHIKVLVSDMRSDYREVAIRLLELLEEVLKALTEGSTLREPQRKSLSDSL